MRTLLIGLALASTLAGGVAVAQPAPQYEAGRDMRTHGGARGFMRADINRDGVVTRGEARTSAERMFAQRDANRDGRLTAEEMRSKHHARRGADTQRAGKVKRPVSLAKFEQKAMRRFDRLDANKDGRVAMAEVRQHKLDKKQHRGGERRARG